MWRPAESPEGTKGCVDGARTRGGSVEWGYREQMRPDAPVGMTPEDPEGGSGVSTSWPRWPGPGGAGFSQSHVALRRQVLVVSLGGFTLGPRRWLGGISELGLGTPDLAWMASVSLFPSQRCKVEKQIPVLWPLGSATRPHGDGDAGQAPRQSEGPIEASRGDSQRFAQL